MRKEAANPQKSKSKPERRDGDQQQLTAAISLYRGDRRVLYKIPLRGQDGNALPGSLDLCLLDFMPDSEVARLEERIRQEMGEHARASPIRDMLPALATLKIPFHGLCSDLANAKKRQDKLDKTPSPPPTPAAALVRGGQDAKRKATWNISEDGSEQGDCSSTRASSINSDESSKNRRTSGSSTGTRNSAGTYHGRRSRAKHTAAIAMRTRARTQTGREGL